MPKNFSQIVESQSNIIRSMIDENKTDTQIINEKKINRIWNRKNIC